MWLISLHTYEKARGTTQINEKQFSGIEAATLFYTTETETLIQEEIIPFRNIEATINIFKKFRQIQMTV